MAHEPYITLKELAQRGTTGLSEGTLWKMAKQGMIRSYSLMARGIKRRLVLESEVWHDLQRYGFGGVHGKRAMEQKEETVSGGLAASGPTPPEILPMPGRRLRVCSQD